MTILPAGVLISRAPVAPQSESAVPPRTRTSSAPSPVDQLQNRADAVMERTGDVMERTGAALERITTQLLLDRAATQSRAASAETVRAVAATALLPASAASAAQVDMEKLAEKIGACQKELNESNVEGNKKAGALLRQLRTCEKELKRLLPTGALQAFDREKAELSGRVEELADACARIRDDVVRRRDEARIALEEANAQLERANKGQAASSSSSSAAPASSTHVQEEVADLTDRAGHLARKLSGLRESLVATLPTLPTKTLTTTELEIRKSNYRTFEADLLVKKFSKLVKTAEQNIVRNATRGSPDLTAILQKINKLEIEIKKKTFHLNELDGFFKLNQSPQKREKALREQLDKAVSEQSGIKKVLPKLQAELANFLTTLQSYGRQSDVADWKLRKKQLEIAKQLVEVGSIHARVLAELGSKRGELAAAPSGTLIPGSIAHLQGEARDAKGRFDAIDHQLNTLNECNLAFQELERARNPLDALINRLVESPNKAAIETALRKREGLLVELEAQKNRNVEKRTRLEEVIAHYEGEYRELQGRHERFSARMPELSPEKPGLGDESGDEEQVSVPRGAGAGAGAGRLQRSDSWGSFDYDLENAVYGGGDLSNENSPNLDTPRSQVSASDSGSRADDDVEETPVTPRAATPRALSPTPEKTTTAAALVLRAATLQATATSTDTRGMAASRQAGVAAVLRAATLQAAATSEDSRGRAASRQAGVAAVLRAATQNPQPTERVLSSIPQAPRAAAALSTGTSQTARPLEARLPAVADSSSSDSSGSESEEGDSDDETVGLPPRRTLTSAAGSTTATARVASGAGARDEAPKGATVAATTTVLSSIPHPDVEILEFLKRNLVSSGKLHYGYQRVNATWDVIKNFQKRRILSKEIINALCKKVTGESSASRAYEVATSILGEDVMELNKAIDALIKSKK